MVLGSRPGAVAQGAEEVRDRGGSAVEDPAQGDLTPDLRRRASENARKLMDWGLPCRYESHSIHADLPIYDLHNLYIGRSASFFSREAFLENV